jgi:hypothetical protein
MEKNMKTQTLPSQGSHRDIDPETLADQILQQPDLAAQALKALSAEDPRVKYGTAKALRLVSEKAPEALYPQMDFFTGLLDCENTILQWNAILILGNLAQADRKKKLDAILSQYLRPIRGPVMITAANTIRGAARIAAAKPALADRIVRDILRVEKANYQTAECRNVACGHAILALEDCYNQVVQKGPVIDFVKRQLENPRNATRKKAAAFLKRHKNA